VHSTSIPGEFLSIELFLLLKEEVIGWGKKNGRGVYDGIPIT
jgi:hypothetical protein